MVTRSGSSSPVARLITTLSPGICCSAPLTCRGTVRGAAAKVRPGRAGRHGAFASTSVSRRGRGASRTATPPRASRRRAWSRCARCGCARSSRRSPAARATSRLEAPRATSSSTSSSRAVSPAGRARSRAPRRRVAGRGEDVLRRVGVDPPGAHLGAQLGGRVARARAPPGAAAPRSSRGRRPRRRASARPATAPSPAASGDSPSRRGARGGRPRSPRGRPAPPGRASMRSV